MNKNIKHYQDIRDNFVNRNQFEKVDEVEDVDDEEEDSDSFMGMQEDANE